MSHFSVLVIGDNVGEQLAPYQQNNMGDVPEKYLEFEEHEDGNVDAKTGRRGSWENPNAKWDAYRIGGRWYDYFQLKKARNRILRLWWWIGDYVAQAEKGEIDFEIMRKTNRRRAERWWRQYRFRKKIAPSKSFDPFEAYGVCEGDTKYTYIKRQSAIATFAVVKDGKWYARGRMVWFGVVKNKKDDDIWQKEFEQLLADVPDDTLLTVVDCHI